MDRLTFEGNFCDIAKCEFIPGGSFCEDGTCTQRKVWERLKAYEDTRRTPAEVQALSRLFDYIVEHSRTLPEQLAMHNRLRELVVADKAGRVVVLPCKVGDTLWVTGRDNVPREMRLEAPDVRTVCTDEDNLCMSTCNRKPDGFCAYRLRNDGADIGKTVFLTREDAERAEASARRAAKVLRGVEEAPAADVAPVVHGHWTPVVDGNMAQCSQCNDLFDTGDTGGQEEFDLFCGFYKFCPCCGARMDGEPDA